MSTKKAKAEGMGEEIEEIRIREVTERIEVMVEETEEAKGMIEEEVEEKIEGSLRIRSIIRSLNIRKMRTNNIITIIKEIMVVRIL